MLVNIASGIVVFTYVLLALGFYIALNQSNVKDPKPLNFLTIIGIALIWPILVGASLLNKLDIDNE